MEYQIRIYTKIGNFDLLSGELDSILENDSYESLQKALRVFSSGHFAYLSFNDVFGQFTVLGKEVLLNSVFQILKDENSEE